MKFYAIAAAWLGGLQLPFVRRSRVAALIRSIEDAEKAIARLQEDKANLSKSANSESKTRLKAEDEAEQLRDRVLHLSHNNSKLTNKVDQLQSEVDRLCRMVSGVRSAIGCLE